MRLAASVALLGPYAPLPALYEEVLRAWRGLPVATARFRAFTTLGADIRQCAGWQGALRALLNDASAPRDVRVLAAALWAHLRPDGDPMPWPGNMPGQGNDEAWLVLALAHATLPDSAGRFMALLENLADADDGAEPCAPDRLPSPLSLLCFLKGLHDGTLPPRLFTAAVLRLHVLHPAVSLQRPRRSLHRLLDYLGLSALPAVQSAYRELASSVWSQATEEQWPAWQWVTVPGGPELLSPAIEAVQTGTVTLMRLHELKYVPLHASAAASALLNDQTVAGVLLFWLRPELRRSSAFPLAQSAPLQWSVLPNEAAARAVYAGLPWWPAWCAQGFPVAQRAWQQVEAALVRAMLVDADARWHDWLAHALLPEIERIRANLLLARAACGDESARLLTPARDGVLPAIRALALLPSANAHVVETLCGVVHDGVRGAQDAAREALQHIARRQGVRDVEELAHQHLLATAWDAGPLANDRVRVDWRVGAYQLRLSLHAGKVRLEILGPHGALAQVPTGLRGTEAYRQARDAQRETQRQYGTFKRHLEHAMLDGTPLAVGEFRYLLANAVFGHLAERLLWRTAAGEYLLWAGPDRWETLAGAPVSLTEQAPLTLTVAHPALLAGDGVLAAWQSLAADRRLVQPFKQLFREIYVADGESGEQCERFAGHRIDPRLAYAVLRAAGFTPGSGIARRDWPSGVSAHLTWAAGASGRELFGSHRAAEVTTGSITFSRDGSPLVPTEVDPVTFSETLRAADLLVTRAAAQEAELTSRETIALRALLLRQVARSYHLTNIAVPEDGRYALVLGTRGTYRLNLVSGTVLLEPEGRQIVATWDESAWHPAEDGDRTSEIISIALTLAHDDAITDLAFLAQLASHAPVR